MWGYQPHFRILLELLAKDIFSEIGFPTEPKVLLVGALNPKNRNNNPVCVEPEDGEWALEIFDGLIDAIEERVSNHQLQRTFYGDEASMRDKPEVIRRDSVTGSVEHCLNTYDAKGAVRYFCGEAWPVEDYYVVPVIQVPELVFDKFPPLTLDSGKKTQSGHRSFIHAVMATLLEEATQELGRPDPGRSIRGNMRRAEEIVRNAAARFMRTPGIVIQDSHAYVDMFERLNIISSLMYEGTQGIGRLLLVNPNDSDVDLVLRFGEPVPINQPRWARKILQMATSDIALVADCSNIYGLGRLKNVDRSSKQGPFIVEFIDHFHWELRFGDQALIRSRYGQPRLPQEPFDRDRFIENYARLFSEASNNDVELIWKLFCSASCLPHGSMIVVAADAVTEVHRLAQQGTAIVPTLMTEDLLRRVSGIDGSVILDPHGICYAIGVILDGPATSDCAPSRGSRFNSALRYVNANDSRRFAMVVSDDHTIDIMPLLNPIISREEILKNIIALEVSGLGNYHKPRMWLDVHRFYLSEEQCTRVNLALDRIEKLPREVGEIVIHTSRFVPNPDMDDSYLAA